MPGRLRFKREDRRPDAVPGRDDVGPLYAYYSWNPFRLSRRGKVRDRLACILLLPLSLIEMLRRDRAAWVPEEVSLDLPPDSDGLTGAGVPVPGAPPPGMSQ